MELTGLSSVFPVPDPVRTADYYRDVLGFTAIAWLDCSEPHVCLYRDRIEILLLRTDRERVLPNRELYGYGYDAYLYADEPDALERDFRARGAKIVRPLSLTDYRNREFVIEDPDGRWLGIGLKQGTDR